MSNIIEKEVISLLKYLKQEKLPVEIELLALHEATSALWAAHREKRGAAQIKNRLANCYVMLFNIANKMKIRDVDSLILQRIEQIRNNPKNKKRRK
ncbi:MAG: hypothetical protein NTW66_02390 [Candidatus Magasanikbacteria bacterium]|nr:hypothetical protein [Candidatus Magasanikbacteria bacterium]